MITFQEIEAWAALTGTRLSAWEAETLRRLSSAYLAERQDATEEHRPPPTAPLERAVNHQDVSRKLLGIFDQLEAQDATMGLGELAPNRQVEAEKVNRRTSVVRKTPAASTPGSDEHDVWSRG